MVNDEDIRELHRAHYSDDQIFEAAVSAALGAGLYRLECVLTLLHANQPATTLGELSAENRYLVIENRTSLPQF